MPFLLTLAQKRCSSELRGFDLVLTIKESALTDSPLAHDEPVQGGYGYYIIGAAPAEEPWAVGVLLLGQRVPAAGAGGHGNFSKMTN